MLYTVIYNTFRLTWSVARITKEQEQWFRSQGAPIFTSQQNALAFVGRQNKGEN